MPEIKWETGRSNRAMTAQVPPDPSLSHGSDGTIEAAQRLHRPRPSAPDRAHEDVARGGQPTSELPSRCRSGFEFSIGMSNTHALIGPRQGSSRNSIYALGILTPLWEKVDILIQIIL